jgi:hypothetical protein
MLNVWDRIKHKDNLVFKTVNAPPVNDSHHVVKVEKIELTNHLSKTKFLWRLGSVIVWDEENKQTIADLQ